MFYDVFGVSQMNLASISLILYIDKILSHQSQFLSNSSIHVIVVDSQLLNIAFTYNSAIVVVGDVFTWF